VSQPDHRRERIAYLVVAGGFALLIWGPGTPGPALGMLAVLAGAWLHPLAGVAGIAASLPFYLFPRQLGPFAVSAPELGLALVLLALGARSVLTRNVARLSTVAERSPYDGPIALFLAAALLSLLATEYLRLSLRELRTLIVEPVAYFFVVRAVAQTPKQAWRIVGALLMTTTLVAAFGIGQSLFGGAVTEVGGVRRIQGTYLSPNHLGLLLGRVLPFLVALAWLVAARRRLAVVGAVVCAAALGLSFSLGGWLGTGAGLLVVAGLAGGRRAVAAAATVGVIVALAALPLLQVERVLGHFDPQRGTTLVRIQLWQAAIELLRESPLFGIGMDNFLYRYPTYLPAGLAVEPNLSHPHNLILHFWLQLGLLGLAAAAWLLVQFVRRVWPYARSAQAQPAKALAVGSLGSMTDFVTHGMVDNSYFLVDMAFIFWMTLALSLTLTRSKAGDRPPDS
jgi:O-antigen ligase